MLAFAAFQEDGDFLCVQGDSGLGLLGMVFGPVAGHASMSVAIGGIRVCPTGFCSSWVAAMRVAAGGGGERSAGKVARVQRERRLRCALAGHVSPIHKQVPTLFKPLT